MRNTINKFLVSTYLNFQAIIFTSQNIEKHGLHNPQLNLMHSESISEAEFLELCCYYVVMSVCSHCYHNDKSSGGSGERAGLPLDPTLF